MNNTPLGPVRKWPHHAIAAGLRFHNIRQIDVARRLKCSQSQVSKVILRQNAVETKVTEAIWRYLERVLNGKAA
jgi:predicted transcriptional regulator